MPSHNAPICVDQISLIHSKSASPTPHPPLLPFPFAPSVLSNSSHTYTIKTLSTTLSIPSAPSESYARTNTPFPLPFPSAIFRVQRLLSPTTLSTTLHPVSYHARTTNAPFSFLFLPLRHTGTLSLQDGPRDFDHTVMDAAFAVLADDKARTVSLSLSLSLSLECAAADV